MNSHFKSLFAVAAAAAVITAGCSGHKGAADADSAAADSTMTAATATPDLRGQWNIVNIVLNDSDYVRPDEIDANVRQYITFEDSTYLIQTNCNTFQGEYTVKGDSIKFGVGLMTEMACENMAAEDAIRRILPDLATIDVQNDSVVRLNGSQPAECILLQKAKR